VAIVLHESLAAPTRLPLFAAALGAISVFGYAPFVWFPLPILSLALLFGLLGDASPRRALVAGWSYGFGLFLGGVSWIYVSLSTYGGMPIALALLATVLFCAFVALLPALALWLGTRMVAPGWHRVAFALPAAWVLAEWLRGWLFSGFPWLSLGYSQAPHSPLLGYAPVLGLYGVSLAAALAAGSLAVPRRRTLMLLLVTGLLGLVLEHVAWTQPVGEPVKVALLQGNVSQEMKFRPEKLEQTLLDYGHDVLASDARLILLPETALPILRSDLPAGYQKMLADHARLNGGDVVTGIAEGEDEHTYFNSVISLGTSPESHYRKSHLVPFGEFMPPGFAWLLQVLSIPMSDFSRGAADQPPLAVAGQKLAINICYEDAFGQERIAAARDSTMLANISNDAWFGHSLAPRQHLQIGAMRSLETGRWQLRANNTGYTAVIDARGRVRSLLTPFTRDQLQYKVPGMTGLTPYLRWGDWPTLGLSLILLVLARRHA
jgi:apolipoprotein N-acyltransferase